MDIGLRDNARVRPQIRSECLKMPRPCPWLTCRYHLFENSPMWREEMAWGDKRWATYALGLPETCALDVADAGENTLEEVGYLFGVSRERIRQYEELGLKKLAFSKILRGWYQEE